MKRTIATLYGYRFEYAEVDVPLMEAGQAVHAGNGEVRLVRKRNLAFVCDDDNDTVVIPLSEEGKQELVTALAQSLDPAQKRALAGELTGGIVLP